jgi:AbrB family looped-hinge helix DNA binding protein
MRTTVSSKGQIVLPAEVRERDGIRAGDELEVTRVKRGEYRLVRVGATNRGLVDQLLACPERGWFVAVESESTDELG